MAHAPEITFTVRLLSAYGRDDVAAPIVLGSFTCVDSPVLVPGGVRRLVLAHHPKTDIDLDARAEIKRQDGSLFNDPLLTVDNYLTPALEKGYSRSSQS